MEGDGVVGILTGNFSRRQRLLIYARGGGSVRGGGGRGISKGLGWEGDQ